MSLQDGDTRQLRLQERKQLMKEQQSINKQMLALLDEEDQLQYGAPPSSQQHRHSTQADSIQQQDANTTDDVAFTGPSTQTAKKRKKRPSQIRRVLSSDSEDAQPLVPMRKKRMPRAPKTKTDDTVPSLTAPPSMAPPSTAPPSTAARKAYKAPNDKYPIYHRTPDNRYDMIVVVGDHVVELACCFCGGNHFKHCGVWKSMVGVHGVKMHIQVSHKDDESKDKDKRAFDWVTRNCVRKILLESDMEDVRSGTYVVEEVHVRTLGRQR